MNQGEVPGAWLANPALIAPPHQLRTDAPLVLDCGRTLPGGTVNFETYGTLSASRGNAILVCHSLTHRAHAAGRHARQARRDGVDRRAGGTVRSGRASCWTRTGTS